MRGYQSNFEIASQSALSLLGFAVAVAVAAKEFEALEFCSGVLSTAAERGAVVEMTWVVSCALMCPFMFPGDENIKSGENCQIAPRRTRMSLEFGRLCRISFVRINLRRGRHECLTHQMAGQHEACLISATFCTSSDTYGNMMQSWFFEEVKLLIFFAESLLGHFGHIGSINSW